MIKVKFTGKIPQVLQTDNGPVPLVAGESREFDDAVAADLCRIGCAEPDGPAAKKAVEKIFAEADTARAADDPVAGDGADTEES